MFTYEMTQVPESSSSVEKVIDQLISPDATLYNDVQTGFADHSSPWKFSLYHVDTVKSLQEDLNALALIATFLAAVQAQVVSYSFDSNSSKLDVAVNALFFAGLLLDILGGCVAYVVAIQLQHIYSLLVRRKSSVSQITASLRQYIPPKETSDSPVAKEAQAVSTRNLLGRRPCLKSDNAGARSRKSRDC
ncbi:hypothetical protein CPB84DRAFT_655149 [Gymnopilus junonius]|uniref:Uncharacterized protein n=1 Tax=Gymnopilus junonius TaxID=109634 RepID=A0A9P5NSC2_GYMJU|nr:hypothetical protein CPB84DRAFT_655149 [Gymnopilus junonius]